MAGLLVRASVGGSNKVERAGQFNHGFAPKAWEAAKAEARAIMYEVARKQSTIAYSDLVSQIRSIRLTPHDVRWDHFLGEIAREDDDEGMGLTSVAVVHKTGDMQPGPGFFEMAESQGREFDDRTACWVEELKSVYRYWSGRKR